MTQLDHATQPDEVVTFDRGDFVLVNEPDATVVGIVSQLRPGKIDVLWAEQVVRGGSAKVHGQTHEPGRLRLATSGDNIPEALRRLRSLGTSL